MDTFYLKMFTFLSILYQGMADSEMEFHACKCKSENYLSTTYALNIRLQCEKYFFVGPPESLQEDIPTKEVCEDICIDIYACPPPAKHHFKISYVYDNDLHVCTKFLSKRSSSATSSVLSFDNKVKCEETCLDYCARQNNRIIH